MLPVTDGLVVHLDADAIEGLNDNDPVAIWEDQSGEGYDVAQSVATSKPIYKINILKGKPVVRFDGADDYLDAAPFPQALAQPNTVIAVVQLHSAIDGTVIQSTVSKNRHALTARGEQWIIYAGNVATGGIVIYDPVILSALYNTTSSYLWVNGVETLSAVNVGSEAYGGVRIGSNLALAAWFHGDIAEILVYNHALSDSEREQVEQYLGEKWLGWSVEQQYNVDTLRRIVEKNIYAGNTYRVVHAEQAYFADTLRGIASLDVNLQAVLSIQEREIGLGIQVRDKALSIQEREIGLGIQERHTDLSIQQREVELEVE